MKSALAGAIIVRAARAIDAVLTSTEITHGGIDRDRLMIGFDGHVNLVGWLSDSAGGAADDVSALGRHLWELLTLRRQGDVLLCGLRSL